MNASRLPTITLLLCVSVLAFLLPSCASKPTDVRTLIPADALVYLGTGDLGRAVEPITQAQSFRDLAKTQPDISFLRGISVAVAVTGFETSERPVTDENSVLKLQPHFVAVAETNAWNFQTLSFTEDKLGEFVNNAYGGEVQLERSDKHGGQYFVWTGGDGQKAYALVIGSVIFFGNDESAIEKCLAVKRGEADSIASVAEAAGPDDAIAYGYISPDGVAQVANIGAVSLAMEAGDDGDVQTFIARVLPEVVRNSARSVTWAATIVDGMYVDKFSVATTPDVTSVFVETLAPASGADADLLAHVPSSAVAATLYNLKDARVAWRSVVLTAQKKTDATSGNLLAAFSGSLFDPYGVEDAESFLGEAGPHIVTVRFDEEGTNLAVIVPVKDAERIKRSITKEIDFTKPAEKQFGADVWRSSDGGTAAAFIGGRLILGDGESVLKCLDRGASGPLIDGGVPAERFAGSGPSAVTFGKTSDPAARIVNAFSERKDENAELLSTYLTETRFDAAGMHRTTRSEFGLIGSIIERVTGE